MINDLVIGVLHSHSQCQFYSLEQEECYNINSQISSLGFKSMGLRAFGARGYYKDLSFIGRHFQVQAINPRDGNRRVGPKRQFTIANAMSKHSYDGWMALMEAALACSSREQFKDLQIEDHLLNGEDAECVHMTVKNYHKEAGLSEKFFEPSFFKKAYEIQGPMGKGLELTHASRGLHVAFSAGTGALAFIDLVLRIFLSNIGAVQDKDEKLHDQFIFVLYQSFQNRESSCCLEMLEKVAEFNDKFGFKNFSLKLRLSNVKGKHNQYWTKAFVLEEVETLLEELGETVPERQSGRLQQDTGHALRMQLGSTNEPLPLNDVLDDPLRLRAKSSTTKSLIQNQEEHQPAAALPKGAQKIWVCGTPQLNEMFDKLASEAKDKRTAFLLENVDLL